MVGEEIHSSKKHSQGDSLADLANPLLMRKMDNP